MGGGADGTFKSDDERGGWRTGGTASSVGAHKRKNIHRRDARHGKNLKQSQNRRAQRWLRTQRGKGPGYRCLSGLGSRKSSRRAKILALVVRRRPLPCVHVRSDLHIARFSLLGCLTVLGVPTVQSQQPLPYLRSQLCYGCLVFAGTYRAATVRERSADAHSPRSVKHPLCC